MLVKYGQ
jgi:hypothetical protein